MRWLFHLLISIYCIFLMPCLAKKAPPLDAETQEFISKLAHQPELMNINYLQYFVGRPENERSQRALTTKHYIWYLPSRQVRCELTQVEQAPGQVIESAFVIPFYDSTLTFDDLKKIYGATARHFYDYDGQAARLYSFVPNTAVTFTSPQNSFRIQKAKITYRGPALPTPGIQDVSGGHDHLMKRVYELGAQEQWDQIMPPLIVHLKEHPEDGDAHYWLGRAYAKQGQLYEAISEYKAALATVAPDAATSPNNGNATVQGAAVSDLKQRCLLGLQELRAIPAASAETQQLGKSYEMVQKGQRIRVAKAKKVKAKQMKQGKGNGNASNQAEKE